MQYLKVFTSILIILFLFSLKAKGQDIGSIKLKNGIKLNGSLGFNTIYYNANGLPNRRDPFNWFLTGNLNINLFGYNTPFSFSYSNVNRNFSQPFNQFSFSPRYKWVKTYIGYNSMNFSQYSLAGHVFLGGGIELTPKNWHFSAMYGRLRKPVPYSFDDSLAAPLESSYKRMGAGLKAGFDNGSDRLFFILFHAYDDENSIPFDPPPEILTPKRNLVMGGQGRKQIGKGLFVEAEYTLSILNNNTRSISLDTAGLLDNDFAERQFVAYNAAIGYQKKWYSIRLKYEEVAPEYETLGAYFFNNDFRNITIIPTVSLLKNKLNLSMNAGLQSNNLDETRGATTERFVGSWNASFTPDEHWNINGSYSNFSTFTNMRPPNDPFFTEDMDTLNFYQVNNTYSGTASYNFGGDKIKNAIIVTTSFQRANEESAYQQNNTFSNFFTGNLSYSRSIIASNTTLAGSFNYYSSKGNSFSSIFYGPNLSLSKLFFEKKLRSVISSSYNYSENNGKVGNSVINNAINLNYSPKSSSDKNNFRQNFSLSILYLIRSGNNENNGYSELTTNLNYNLSF
jgi:hypothetical protein